MRFHLEETGKGHTAAGDKVRADKESVKAFRKQLSLLGDVFVNDAFGASHRAHSSVVGVDCPVKCAGLLVAKELKSFQKILNNPPRPMVAILGGAKVADKIKLVSSLIDKVDHLVIGGGMAYTFLKVIHGIEIGRSIYDKAGAEDVLQVVAKAKSKGVSIHLPKDFICADSFSADAKTRVCTLKTGVPPGWMALDCGPSTSIETAQVLWRAKAIVMNGPLGVFEMNPFSSGTRSALEAIAAVTQLGECTSIIGGGDSAAACKMFHMEHLFSHISTGGGASLELLEGKQLPGIDNLDDNPNSPNNPNNPDNPSSPVLITEAEGSENILQARL